MHASEVGLNDMDDDVIFPWARREERVVITSDADFSAMLAQSGAVASVRPGRLRVRALPIPPE